MKTEKGFTNLTKDIKNFEKTSRKLKSRKKMKDLEVKEPLPPTRRIHKVNLIFVPLFGS